MKQQPEMMQVDRADLRHAARQQRISDRRGEHDGEQNEIPLRCEGVLHRVSSEGPERGKDFKKKAVSITDADRLELEMITRSC